jgi:hypothetical protein
MVRMEGSGLVRVGGIGVTLSCFGLVDLLNKGRGTVEKISF